MTQLSNSPNLVQRRQEWTDRVSALVDQIAEWCHAEGWEAERRTKTLRERLFGEYEVAALLIRLPAGEVQVEPIALHTIGADGRVDVKAFPTLSRVRLVGGSQGWKIMTDSNVPLRVPWNRESFAQLIQDLLA